MAKAKQVKNTEKVRAKRKMSAEKIIASVVSDDQVRQLGERLHGSSTHIYHTALAMFGIEVGDEILDRLKILCDLRKCNECNLWLKASEEFESEKPMQSCRQCVSRMEEEEEEDEDIDDGEDDE